MFKLVVNKAVTNGKMTRLSDKGIILWKDISTVYYNYHTHTVEKLKTLTVRLFKWEVGQDLNVLARLLCLSDSHMYSHV